MNQSPLLKLAILLALLSVYIQTSSAQEVRDWTTRDGIKHRGSVMFMSGKSVTLKGASGMLTLPLSKLSDGDLAYIAEVKAGTKKMQNPGIPANSLPPSSVKPGDPAAVPTAAKTSTIPSETPASPPATWPSEIRTSFSPADIVTVSETKQDGYIYRSPHFEFRSPIRLPHRAVREFSLIFEATYDFADAMPIGLNPQPGGNGFYVTQLFDTTDEYYQAGGPPGSAGAFFPTTGKILVPLPSLGVKRSQNNIEVVRGAAGNTLIHEVTHQVMMRWLPLIPVWIGEGFAEITSAQPYEAGRFVLSRMSRSVRESTGRGPGAGRSFEMVPLEKLMHISSQAWGAAVAEEEGLQNYRSASVLVYYFLHFDGRGKGEALIAYINARLKGTGATDAEEKYLLAGRSYGQLEEDVARAWREEGLKISYSK
jgi:hypothetical protein